MTDSRPPQISAWLAELGESAGVRRQQGLWRDRLTIAPEPLGRCRWNNQLLWNFASNDYLGLAADERVIAAAREVTAAAGAGARASALVCGRTPWHERLEQTLTRFEEAEQTTLFPSGMAANMGLLAALVSPSDVVFCDRLNHASLIDGCRQTGTTLRVYRHDRLDVLRRELLKAKPALRKWIVTDGVFSMDGDLAPLASLCDLAEEFGALVMVDEAHGTGVFGKQGRGACEAAGVEQRVAVRVGTLSKAIGSIGGFVSGPTLLADHLWQHARTQIYSTALPPGVCAAATRAIEIIEQEPQHQTALQTRALRLRQGLHAAGVSVLGDNMGDVLKPGSPYFASPIVPVFLGDAGRTMQIGAVLRSAGFLVGAIRPPAVPPGESRLRLTVTAAHPIEAIDALVGAVASAMERYPVGV